MRKFFLIGAAFLLITGPGALDAWLSLFDRFVGEAEEPVNVSIGDWYQAIFPILGLIILLGVILLTGNKKETPISAHTKGSRNAVRQNQLETVPATESTNPLPGVIVHDTHAILEGSIASLVGIFKDRTTAEAEPIVVAYIGRQVVVKARVFDVDKNTYGKKQYRVSLTEPGSNALIFARFDEQWSDQMAKLRKQQIITVLGSVRSIDRLSVSLESCSLIASLNE